MESKYLKYDIEELLEDKYFVDWVLHGKNKSKWEKFVEMNPEFNLKLIQAQRIFLLLKDVSDELDEESIRTMWENINRFEQNYNKKNHSIRLRKTVSIAASILIIISLGVFGYLYKIASEQDYEFVSSDNIEIKSSGNSRLILSDGDEILLEKDNSSVQLNDEGEILINNDSIVNISENKGEAEQGIKYNEVVVPYGKRSELFLSDGTKVWLNAGSRIAFPTKFTDKTRTVYLVGEACFKVVKNENQPFIVKAGQLDVEVLGTFFDVSAYESDNFIKTVLLEGSVAVHKPTVLGIGKNSVYLKPNQKASFIKEDNEISVSDAPNAILTIAWTEGWLQFSRESLNSILTKLERYYNVDVEISNGFPSSGLITGKLDLKESLQDVLIALSDVAEITFRISGNKVFIDERMKELPNR